MFKKVSRIFLVLIAVSFFAAGLALSAYSYSSSQKISDENLAAEGQIVYVFGQSEQVLNASYSAVPKLDEEIISQRGFSKGLITQKGDDLLVLVNKSISLPSSYQPADLVGLNKLVSSSLGSQLRSEAAAQLVQLFAAAKGAGYNLTVTSSYRSYENQAATFAFWVKQLGLAAAVRVSAEAGHSQHQLGTAVDISSASVNNTLTESFGATAEGGWLEKNSWKYGYVLSYPAGKEHITGYAYEPWHYRYIGIASATKMHNLGLDLETFLQKNGVW